MGGKYICIAGKNSIAIAGLSYVITNYSQKATLLALCDDNDTGMDSWQPSFKKFAKMNNIQLVDLESLYEIENLCFISLEYFKLLDPRKFKTKNLFNIHFSLLPAYRGMYTSAHPILNRESEAGCTFHRIDSGIDTGDIISQVRCKLTGEENCKDLYWKYLFHGRELTFTTVDSLINDNFQCKGQSEVGSSYYSKKINRLLKFIG
jgi:methionyl-tRNA formyltransferase